MGLYEKMYNVMIATEGLEKNLEVGSGSNRYKAVGESEVLNMLKPLFKAQRLIIFPIDGTIDETNATWEHSSFYDGKPKVETKTRNITQLRVLFKIIDIDSGESETLCGFGNGADSQDKGSGKAFTYAFKTMLSKSFMLFSGEDTDNEHSDDIGYGTPKDKPQPTDKITTQRLIDMAKSKNITEKGLINRYKVDTGKDITEIKFLPADFKLKYYNTMKELVIE